MQWVKLSQSRLRQQAETAKLDSTFFLCLLGDVRGAVRNLSIVVACRSLGQRLCLRNPGRGIDAVGSGRLVLCF